MGDRTGPTMLGRGIYDPLEAARLVRVHPETLGRWTAGPGALVTPSLGGSLFDFEDLVSLVVVAELRRRDVPFDEIRRGIELLVAELGVGRPLAHEAAPRRLATVGPAFFFEAGGEWVDIGKGFQRALQAVVEPVLDPLEYNARGVARLWRPHRHVALSPRVQAGAPCVEGTRVPTAAVVGLIEAGEPMTAVALDLELEFEQLTAAVQYEAALAAPLTGPR